MNDAYDEGEGEAKLQQRRGETPIGEAVQIAFHMLYIIRSPSLAPSLPDTVAISVTDKARTRNNMCCMQDAQQTHLEPSSQISLAPPTRMSFGFKLLPKQAKDFG